MSIISSSNNQKAREKALKYANRIGLTDPNKIQALVVFCEIIFGQIGISKFPIIYPFIGGTSFTHAQNLIDTTFQITWFGSLTHDSNGITGDGSTGYGLTSFSQASNGQLGSFHMSAYCKTQTPATNTRLIAATTSTGGTTRLGIFVNTSTFVSLEGISYNTTSASTLNISSDYRKFFVASRTSTSNQFFTYNGGNSPGGDSTSVSLPVAQNIAILARNNESGGLDSFSNANLAFASLGLGLTNSEVAAYYNAVQNLQVALGRNN